MSYIFEQEEYESLMYNPSYKKYEFFRNRASQIKGKFSNTNTSILVAGVGFGYLIEELNNLGYMNVYGIDASNYAYAHNLFPQKTVKGNVLNTTDLQKARQLAGFKGNKIFDVCITEDLMPCCINENEAIQIRTNLLTVSSNLLHVITCANGTSFDELRHPSLLWLTVTRWKQVLSNDFIVDVEAEAVI